MHDPRKLIALFTAAIHLRNRHHKGEVAAEQLRPARQEFDQRLRYLAWPAREVPASETLSAHVWKPWDEGGWHHLKDVEMRNLVCRDLDGLHQELDLAVGRLRQKPHLVRSFFAQAGLSLKET